MSDHQPRPDDASGPIHEASRTMASEERVAVVKPANFGKSLKDTAEYLEHRINSTDNKLNQVIDNIASNQAKIDARFAELGRLFERQSVGQGQKQPVMSNNELLRERRKELQQSGLDHRMEALTKRSGQHRRREAASGDRDQCYPQRNYTQRDYQRERNDSRRDYPKREGPRREGDKKMNDFRDHHSQNDKEKCSNHKGDKKRGDSQERAIQKGEGRHPKEGTQESLVTSSEAQPFKTPSPTEPTRRTCGYCQLLCSSRNALFEHLRSCESVKALEVEKTANSACATTPVNKTGNATVPLKETADAAVPYQKVSSVGAPNPKTPSPTSPARRTCGHCHLLCASRNALFEHLRACKSSRAVPVAEAIVAKHKQDGICFKDVALSREELGNVSLEASRLGRGQDLDCSTDKRPKLVVDFPPVGRVEAETVPEIHNPKPAIVLPTKSFAFEKDTIIRWHHNSPSRPPDVKRKAAFVWRSFGMKIPLSTVGSEWSTTAINALFGFKIGVEAMSG